MKFLIIAVILIAFGIWVAPGAIQNAPFVIGVSLGLFFLFLGLTNFETGLMILLMLIPLSLQMNLGHMGGGDAPVDIGTDDFFIYCLILSWMVYLAKSHEAPFASNPMTTPFMAYFFACVASFIPMMIHNKGNLFLSTFHLVKWYQYVLVYFILVKIIETRQQVIRFVIANLVSCMLMAGTHFFLIIKELIFGSGSGFDVQGVMGSFESNGILGSIYLFYLSILTSFLVTYQSTKTRLLLGACCVVMSVTLFYSFARAAYLGAMIGFIALGFLHRKKLVIISLLLLAFVPAFTSKLVSENISTTIKIEEKDIPGYRKLPSKYSSYGSYKLGGKTIQLDASSTERLISWAKARRAIDYDPVLGNGYWSGRFIGVFRYTTAHNQFITIMIETGIVGLLAFLWIGWAGFYNAATMDVITSDPFFLALGRGFAAGFLGVLVGSFFGETFEAFRITANLWVVAALTFAARRISFRESYPAQG